MLEVVRGLRQVRHIGVQTIFEESGDAVLYVLSVNDGI